MKQLIHIRGALEGKVVKFFHSPWKVIEEREDGLNVHIGGDEDYPSFIPNSMIGVAHPDINPNPNEHLGWVVVQKGNEAEGEKLLVKSAMDQALKTAEKLLSASQSFQRKADRLENLTYRRMSVE